MLHCIANQWPDPHYSNLYPPSSEESLSVLNSPPSPNVLVLVLLWWDGTSWLSLPFRSILTILEFTGGSLRLPPLLGKVVLPLWEVCIDLISPALLGRGFGFDLWRFLTLTEISPVFTLDISCPCDRGVTSELLGKSENKRMWSLIWLSTFFVGMVWWSRPSKLDFLIFFKEFESGVSNLGLNGIILSSTETLRPYFTGCLSRLSKSSEISCFFLQCGVGILCLKGDTLPSSNPSKSTIFISSKSSFSPLRFRLLFLVGLNIPLPTCLASNSLSLSSCVNNLVGNELCKSSKECFILRGCNSQVVSNALFVLLTAFRCFGIFGPPSGEKSESVSSFSRDNGFTSLRGSDGCLTSPGSISPSDRLWFIATSAVVVIVFDWLVWFSNVSSAPPSAPKKGTRFHVVCAKSYNAKCLSRAKYLSLFHCCFYITVKDILVISLMAHTCMCTGYLKVWHTV